MSTYRELVYTVLDQIKVLGGDQTITEGHVIYLANKYRAYLLKNKIKTEGESSVGTSSMQAVCLNLEKVPSVDTLEVCTSSYLKSEEEVPSLLANPKIETMDRFSINVTYVTPERFAVVGHNKYMRNIIYCTIGSDNHLYMKSMSPQFLYMDRLRLYGVFEDSDKAYELSCDDDGVCDILDRNFPLDEELMPSLVDTLVKVFYSAEVRPEDSENNDMDDIASLAQYVRNNMKSDLAKQLMN